MPRALTALLCAGLIARAAHGQDGQDGVAAELAPPPPSPPAVARAPSVPRPRIHIYDLPDSLTKPCHWWGCGRLTEEVRRSKYYEPNPDAADFWWIPHMQPFKSQNVTETLYATVASRWPYWNASIAAKQSRHLITLTCDHGPGDCNFVDHQPIRLGMLPNSWNPASPERVVSHVQWNSMRDGADAGMDHCSVCFQYAKDIQIATPEGNVCGPLCGYNRSVLEQTSIWGPKGRALFAKREAIQRRAGLPARGNLLYYGGKIHGQRGMEDPSGRAQLLLMHGNRSGFRIQRSWDWVKLEPIPTGSTYADEMPNATFCYCPLGHDSGDVDRYIPAILFGCIPVMLVSTIKEGRRVPIGLPLEEHPDIHWRSFAVLLELEDMPRLPEILARVTRADLRRMRHEMRKVWPRLLYTSFFGSYLGEDGANDAFESFMTVLRWRLPGLGLATEQELQEQEKAAALPARRRLL